MKTDFNQIFAGKGVWAFKRQQNHLIQHFLSVHPIPNQGLPVAPWSMFLTHGTEKLRNPRPAVWTAYPNYRQTPT